MVRPCMAHSTAGRHNRSDNAGHVLLEAKLIDPNEIKRVEEILNRLAPRLQKMLTRMMEKDGHTVTLSVAANISTSLMSTCLLMVAQKGGDVESFMNVLLQETGSKYTGAKMEVEAIRAKIRDDMVQSGWDTCRPLH